MKVLQLTSKLRNGAGIAAVRLHERLRHDGVESVFYFGVGSTGIEGTRQAFRREGFVGDSFNRLLAGLRARTEAGEGYVNNPRWWVKARSLPDSFDVVHIHSLFGWVDLESVFRLIPCHTPIVWSLHDFEPITGGCIYPGECAGWETSCAKCPQLRPGLSWRTRRNHRIKSALFGKRRINFVCNSTWTLEQANKSSLISLAASTSMINYGLNLEAYRPVDKQVAKRALGLDKSLPVIGFASTDLSEKRKGFAVLQGALRRLGVSKVMLLSFGGGQADGSLPNHVHLGPVYSVDVQRLFYSAIDVFVTPSLVETFGNTAMEAMACGTPVVGYATSGLKDVVVSGVTGMLQEPVGCETAIWQALEFLVSNPEARTKMGVAARRRAEECFDVRLMAARYKKLYSGLAENSRPPGVSTP
jgi:glycosyltransferase involved in cell wall biosynthesis